MTPAMLLPIRPSLRAEIARELEPEDRILEMLARVIREGESERPIVRVVEAR